MSYVAKTDWKHSDPISEHDLNRWENGIKEANDLKQLIDNHSGDLNIHVTPEEKAGWDGKASSNHTHINATSSVDGFMSSTDKTALDNAQKWKLTLDNGNSKAIATNDADNEKDAGLFATYSNTLNVPEVGGHLQVIKRDVNQSVQIFYGLANRNVYVRYWIQYWTPWKRLTDNNTLGGVLLGNKLIDTQMANFINKIAGSTTANPHTLRRTSSSNISGYTTLTTPSQATSILQELNQAEYDKSRSLDGDVLSNAIPGGSHAAFSQQLFSFDLIAHVERTYGTIPGATTADKVVWLKVNVSKLTFNWHGFGSSPTGNKATFGLWDIGGVWNATVSHTAGSTQKLTVASTQLALRVDSNGFVHALAYADPSNGTTASVINTDYVELQVELSTSLKDNMKPVWIDATLQNGWVEFDADRKPRYSIGSDGFVTLKGAVKSGTYGVATPVLTLPSGFRPLAITYSVAVAGTNTDKFITVRVNTSGQVSVIAQGTADNTLASLDGVRFPTN